MQTLLEILNKTTEYFKKCGVPDARLDAQYILAKGLSMTRMDLYLKFDRPVTDDELARMRPMVQRRGKREPLQHILGSTSFRGLEIQCDARALIPRPETEVLVEKALEIIAEKKNPILADVGTGTGAIAIALATARPDAIVYAFDISAEALQLAQINVNAHKLTERVILVKSDLLSAAEPSLAFDCIVSNPPYIPHAMMPDLQPEVRSFDPALALDGGADGLDLVRPLYIQAQNCLKPGAGILLEVGEGQVSRIQQEILSYPGLIWGQSFKDFQGVVRFPLLFRKDIGG